MIAASPSQRPSSTSARRIGRARIASSSPFSISGPIAGDAAKTAVIASTKLNMNASITRICETAGISSGAGHGAETSAILAECPAGEDDDDGGQADERPQQPPPQRFAERQAGDDREWPTALIAPRPS